jgi:4-amino-4-deoxy-L-arabinose transferase-like glycosyltransferase
MAAARQVALEGRIATASRHALERLSYCRALALVTALGALLRLAFIARQPIGYDEDFTAVVVHQPVGRMIDIVSRDSAPPLFYLLERGVVAVADLAGLATFGGPGGPVALRLVPAFAGIAAIPLLAALARRMGGDAAGIWAAVFVAVVPTTVMLSGFARMYGLAATLTVAAALALWRFVEKPGAPRWAAYAAVAAAAVWSDYFSAVALAGIFLAALWLRPGWRVALAGLAATAVAVGSIVPWLVVAQAQFEHAGHGFWVPPLGPAMVVGTLAQLFMGPPVDGRVPFAPILVGLQVVAVVAGASALAGAGFAWRRFGPAGGGPAGGGRAEGRRAAVFCLLASSGVALLAVASLWRPLLDARYASLMWLPLFALVGVGLMAMPRRVAGVLVAAVAVPTLALSIATTHTETSSLIPELEARVGPTDLVAASWDHYLVLLDEAGPVVRSRLHVAYGGNPPWYFGTAAYPPGAVIHTVPAHIAASHSRVFWVAGPGAVLPGLPTGYRSLESRCEVLVCLTIYGPGG